VSDDRRKSPRFRVGVPALIFLGTERFMGQLKDICRDAALVETQRNLSLGTELALALALPGTGGPLQVAGKVVRVAPGEDSGQDVAVLFTNVTPHAETRIDFFVALQTQGNP
jgi:Tfp pilus assembly protein PilZ